MKELSKKHSSRDTAFLTRVNRNIGSEGEGITIELEDEDDDDNTVNHRTRGSHNNSNLRKRSRHPSNMNLLGPHMSSDGDMIIMEGQLR